MVLFFATIPVGVFQENEMMETAVRNDPTLLMKAAQSGKVEVLKVVVAALEAAGQHLLEKVRQLADGKHCKSYPGLSCFNLHRTWS